MGPLLLSPAGKDYLWGGERLKNEYGKNINMTPLAETWECSTHPDGMSIVTNGCFAGKYLSDVLKSHPEFLGRNHYKNDGLPILIKLIDAEQDLSVQVHPDDEYAAEHENDHGKTEMWYVLDAKPGASLIYGFAHPVTKTQLKNAIKNNELSKHLQRVPVKKGDVFYIPAGTIHAVGSGIVLAEVQESSNVTYRVYDYGRIDKDGKPRKLMLDKAAAVLNMKPADVIKQRPKLVRYYPGASFEILCRCRYFNVERVQTSGNCGVLLNNKTPVVILCIEGKGSCLSEKARLKTLLKKGDCAFFPADSEATVFNGRASFLKITF